MTFDKHYGVCRMYGCSADLREHEWFCDECLEIALQDSRLVRRASRTPTDTQVNVTPTERLASIRARLEAATPDTYAEGNNIWSGARIVGQADRGDAELWAHATSDLAALLEVAEAALEVCRFFIDRPQRVPIDIAADGLFNALSNLGDGK